MKANTQDMTKGNPFRIILQFAVPLFLGNIFQQLYNMVDAIVVGRFVGTGALAAVGASASSYSLIISAVNGFASGAYWRPASTTAWPRSCARWETRGRL